VYFRGPLPLICYFHEQDRHMTMPCACFGHPVGHVPYSDILILNVAYISVLRNSASETMSMQRGQWPLNVRC
jgi:hypothetical protein